MRIRCGVTPAQRSQTGLCVRTEPLSPRALVGLEVLSIELSLAVREGERDYPMEYTWHVDRPTYDQILADCAADHGAAFAFRWPRAEA